MSLIDQLAAERKERNKAVNEAIRIGLDPNRFRSDADRARLAATAAARIAAQEELNDARLENLAVERSIRQLSNKDGHSLFFRDISPSRMTAKAREYVERGRQAQEAVEDARERLQEAIRAHNKAQREVDAAAAARRRQAKREAGQL